MRNNRINVMMISALLCAVGIIIPMFSPIKIVIEPASFTLASHVAIMIAMFISPTVAATVAVGTTLGFFLGGFPIVVVARAASHIVFATIGALMIQKNEDYLNNTKKFSFLVLLCSLIHAISEVIVVIPFYVGGDATNLFYLIFVLVGVGSVIHSIIDFTISKAVWQVISVRSNVNLYRTKKSV